MNLKKRFRDILRESIEGKHNIVITTPPVGLGILFKELEKNVKNGEKIFLKG